MIPFSIAGMQLQLSAERDNVPHMLKRLDTLMHLYPWVQMVLFSELAPFGPFLSNAQPLPSPAEDLFREAARRHGIWLIPGSMFERVGDKIYNTASVIDPRGEVISRYRKMFPFLPYETGVEAGDKFCVFDVPGVARFGVSICYDMWFQETTRTLVSMGVEVMLHPTMTTTIDRDVELSIARASAATNQCFFFDINGCGDGGNGRSTIIGPYGDVLYAAGDSEEMIPIEIDVARVRRSREFGLRGLGQPLKSFRDRKVSFDLYHTGSRTGAFLSQLGPLVKPVRGTMAGIDGRSIGMFTADDVSRAAPESHTG